LSLDQFFDHVHNRGGNATVLHYVGGRSQEANLCIQLLRGMHELVL
jgi:hypothetical protein